ncbi:MAG TPA: GNAT family N-acetyltransferase [Pseudomonadales bacterium]
MIDYRVIAAPIPAEALESAAALAGVCFDAAASAVVARAAERPDPMLVLASEEGAAVGFKLGYRRSREEFYSWLGGVHPEHRRRGIAEELMRRQHAWCAEAGYREITTETLGDNAPMLILNLRSGFEVVGMRVDERGTKVLLRRRL